MSHIFFCYENDALQLFGTNEFIFLRIILRMQRKQIIFRKKIFLRACTKQEYDSYQSRSVVVIVADFNEAWTQFSLKQMYLNTGNWLLICQLSSLSWDFLKVAFVTGLSQLNLVNFS